MQLQTRKRLTKRMTLRFGKGSHQNRREWKVAYRVNKKTKERKRLHIGAHFQRTQRELKGEYDHGHGHV